MSDLATNNRHWCCSSAWTFIFQLATSYLPPADAIRRFSFLKRPHQTPHPVSLFEKGQTIDQGSGAVNCSRGPRGKKRGRWSDVAHHAQCWLYQPGRGGGSYDLGWLHVVTDWEQRFVLCCRFEPKKEQNNGRKASRNVKSKLIAAHQNISGWPFFLAR